MGGENTLTCPVNHLSPNRSGIYRKFRYIIPWGIFITTKFVMMMYKRSGISIISLVIALLTMTSCNCVRAQNGTSDTLAIKMLREFYTSYMTQFTDLSSGHEQKTNAILKKYCTASLINRIPKLADQTDSDPFLKAQDSDSSWAKSLVIKKDLKRANTYNVSYQDSGDTNTIIHLLVLKQKEGYKIADLW